MNRDQKRPVTVEDLLRLKRAERPAEDFWVAFDRQLRAKQLSALVERRPWWRTLSLASFLAGFRRYHLPFGATTIIALSFVSYRVNQSPVAVEMVPENVGSPAHASSQAASFAAAGAEQGPVDGGHTEIAGTEAETAILETRQDRAVVAPAASAGVSALAVFMGAAAGESALVAAPAAAVAAEGAWNVGAVVEPVLSRSLLASSTRFEAPAMPVRPVVEPLKQITPPGERRGARILTAMVSMSSVETAMRTTERAASRLSEEQLYEQIRRVGAFGAGVNVKF